MSETGLQAIQGAIVAASYAILRAIWVAIVLGWYVILATVLGIGIVAAVPHLLQKLFQRILDAGHKLFGVFPLSSVFDAIGLFTVIVIMIAGGVEAVRVFRSQQLP
jgi:hypothetical protein